MTPRERRHAEWGWITAKIMAKLLYEKMGIPHGFFVEFADKGLQKLTAIQKPSRFGRYKKEKRRCTGLRSSRGSWRPPSSGTSGTTT